MSDGQGTAIAATGTAGSTGRPRRPDRVLLRKPMPDSEALLFCLPFAGTGAGLLRRWPLRLDGLELCRVQLPGRENRISDPAFTDFETFAVETADALVPYLDRPYSVFGHCFGALLAHKLVLRLGQLPVRQPSRLIVSSCLAPHLPPVKRFRQPGAAEEGIYHPSMSDDAFAVEIRRLAQAQGESEILPELLPLAIRALRGDVEMSYRYEPGEPQPVDCPITAIGWSADVDVPPASMAVWDAYGHVSHRVLEGDKLSFLRAPRSLMDLFVADCLSSVEGSGDHD
jgi:surfactin synthase thioesterase subunit